jgi:hypothetical protein
MAGITLFVKFIPHVDEINLNGVQGTIVIQLCDSESFLANGVLVRRHSTRIESYYGIFPGARGMYAIPMRGWTSSSLICLQTTYKRAENKILSEDTNKSNSVDDSKSTASESGSGTPLKSYKSQLAIYNGTFTNASIFSIFLRPFPFLLSPVVSALRASSSQ